VEGGKGWEGGGLGMKRRVGGNEEEIGIERG